MVVIPDEVKTAIYIGKNICGFEKNHKYLIKLDRRNYVYDITAIYDCTNEEETDLFIQLSSEASIKRSFTILKE